MAPRRVTMALCGTTRSQLSPQFHCRYVFRARHSKILGVQVARNYALDANATPFCRKVSSVVSKMATRIPLGIHGPFRLPPWAFWTARCPGGRGNEIEIESDKSSANCIRVALQPALNRASTTITDLSLCDEGRIPLGLDRRETERRLIHPSSRGIISGVQDVSTPPGALRARWKFRSLINGDPFPPRCRLGIPALITLS